MADIDWYTPAWLAEHEDDLIGRFYHDWMTSNCIEGPISSIKAQDDGSVVIKTAWAAKEISGSIDAYESVPPLEVMIPATAKPYEFACRRRIIIVHGDQANPPMIRANIERSGVDPLDVVDFDIRLPEAIA